MSNNPTCLVALRADVGSLTQNLEQKLEKRIGEVEQAFSSMGWELDTARDNLKTQDARNNELFIRLQNTEEKLKTAEAEVEHARLERDEARLKLQDQILARGRLRNLIQAQEGTIAQLRKDVVDLRAVGPALDILSTMIKELEVKLDAAYKSKDELDQDYGKLVGEYEDMSKLFDLLRNLILDPTFTADDLKTEGNGVDRYTAFARAMRIGRHEAKMAIHRLVEAHPLFTEVKQQLDIMVKRTEIESSPTGQYMTPGRVTAEELFIKFKPFVYDLLKCIGDMTSPAVSALQYGSHHGHQTLHKHIVRYRRFLDQRNNQWGTPPGEVPDEVLRDHKG